MPFVIRWRGGRHDQPLYRSVWEPHRWTPDLDSAEHYPTVALAREARAAPGCPDRLVIVGVGSLRDAVAALDTGGDHASDQTRPATDLLPALGAAQAREPRSLGGPAAGVLPPHVM